MSLDNNHIRSFTAEDIRKYWAGQMSPSEMHALETASLDDPFLADALEGYSKTSAADVDADIKWLQKQFNQSEASKKVEPIYTSWLRMAAMFAIVAGLAIFGYFIFSKPQHAPGIATTDVKIKTAPNNPPSVADSSAPIADKRKAISAAKTADDEGLEKPVAPLFIPPAPITNRTQEATLEAFDANKQTDSFYFNYTPAAKSSIAKELDNKAQSIIVVQESNQPQQLARVADNSFQDSGANYLSGRITNTNNEPIKGAVVKLKKQNTITTSDLNGYFNFSKTDTITIANAVVNSIGYEQTTVVLNNGIVNNIQLNQANAALNEVVVIGYGTTKKREVSKTANKSVVDTLQPAPEGGWDDYEEYIDRNKHSFENEQGEVVILFEINKKGKPDNITVEKSLTEQTDKEAVRLVKDGPNWQPADKSKKRKVRVKIRF